MNEQEANAILERLGLEHKVDIDGDFQILYDDGNGPRYFYMTEEGLEAALFLVCKARQDDEAQLKVRQKNDT